MNMELEWYRYVPDFRLNLANLTNFITGKCLETKQKYRSFDKIAPRCPVILFIRDSVKISLRYNTLSLSIFEFLLWKTEYSIEFCFRARMKFSNLTNIKLLVRISATCSQGLKPAFVKRTRLKRVSKAAERNLDVPDSQIQVPTGIIYLIPSLRSTYIHIWNGIWIFVDVRVPRAARYRVFTVR